MRAHFLSLFLIITAVGLSGKVSAQTEFVAPGAQWYYGFYYPGLYEARGYYHDQYLSDTIIAGQSAKIIDRKGYLFDLNNPTIPIDTFHENPVYLRQSGDSISYSFGGPFQLLWKTEVAVGDQFEIPDNFAPFTMTIESVDTVFFNSVAVKKIGLSGENIYGQSGSATIYDQFGPENGFFYNVCWGLYDCYDPVLCRYKNDAMGQIDFSAPVCDILNTEVKEPPANPVNLYPNPFQDHIYISASIDLKNEIDIDIYAPTGKWIFHQRTFGDGQHEIDLSALPAGIYVCRIAGTGWHEVRKLVKIN